MPKIETDVWTPVPDKPGMVTYDHQRSAIEVFRELETELRNIGYYPDEYFLLDDKWKDGCDFPKDAYLHSNVDYGSSEGIYIDISLKVFDEEAEKYVDHKFATGKTLGKSETDLDRMHLVASKITSLFYGGGGHARYIRLGEDPAPESMTFQLNEQERRVMADSLVERRSRQMEGVEATEQLLRRMTGGNILEYVDLVGDRPLRLSAHDKAVLAIQDGDLRRFLRSVEEVKEPEALWELLAQAAGRPGPVGREMMDAMLEQLQPTEPALYEQACKAAVETDEVSRILHLLDRAESAVEAPDLGLPGRVMLQSMEKYERGPRIAMAILNRCGEEQIRQAPPSLLRSCAYRRGCRELAEGLVVKGINPNPFVAEYIRHAHVDGDTCAAYRLLKYNRMQIKSDNYPVMSACLQESDLAPAKCLLDQGMDLEKYLEWADRDSSRMTDPSKLEELREYADSLTPTQEIEPDRMDTPSCPAL